MEPHIQALIDNLPPVTKDQFMRHDPRFEDHTSVCDYSWTNSEAMARPAAERRHNWVSFDIFFGRGISRDIAKEDRARIPNWSVCNFCGIVDTNRQTCEASVHDPFGVSFHICGRGATVPQALDEYGREAKRTRFYCKTHDPVARAAKQAARDRIYYAKRDLERAEEEKRQRDRKAKEELVKVALEMIEWLDVATDIRDEDEWAKTLYKRAIAAKEGLK